MRSSNPNVPLLSGSSESSERAAGPSPAQEDYLPPTVVTGEERDAESDADSVHSDSLGRRDLLCHSQRNSGGAGPPQPIDELSFEDNVDAFPEPFEATASAPAHGAFPDEQSSGAANASPRKLTGYSSETLNRPRLPPSHRHPMPSYGAARRSAGVSAKRRGGARPRGSYADEARAGSGGESRTPGEPRSRARLQGRSREDSGELLQRCTVYCCALSLDLKRLAQESGARFEARVWVWTESEEWLTGDASGARVHRVQGRPQHRTPHDPRSPGPGPRSPWPFCRCGA